MPGCSDSKGMYSESELDLTNHITILNLLAEKRWYIATLIASEPNVWVTFYQESDTARDANREIHRQVVFSGMSVSWVTSAPY